MSNALTISLQGGKLANLENLEVALGETYAPFRDAAQAIVHEAESVVVTDPTQVTEIKKSKALRLALKTLRCEAETKRKEFKAVALTVGRAIDNAHAGLLLIIDPVEKRLADQEKIAERLEAERIAKLGHARAEELGKYTMMVPPPPELGKWPASQYAAYLAGVQQQKAAAEAKAEEERMAREMAEAEAMEERERQAEENRKLAAKLAEERKKAAAAAEKARQERAAAEALARKERDARAKVEAELAARRKAEEDKAKAELEAARKAAAAPDREKLMQLARDIRTFAQAHTVNVSSPEAAEICGYVIVALGRVAVEVERQAKNLSERKS